VNEPRQIAIFEEEQQFRQIWIWIIMLSSSLLMLAILGFGLYQQLYLGKPFGNKPMSNEGLVIVTCLASLVIIGIPVLFYKMTLAVRVDSQYLYINFLPLRRKQILLRDIARWEARTYRPLRDFGGWGLKYSFKEKCWAYNVSGDRGVQLELTNGKRLLIGSQRAEALAEAIKQAKRR